MKKILEEWGAHIFVSIVILGLGSTLIYQDLSHTSKRLKDGFEHHQEYISLFNFNQQVIEDNNKLRESNIRQGIQIKQMDDFIGQMYRRLQIYEPLPDLPGDKDNNKPNRSEA